MQAIDELLDWTRLSLADGLFSVGIAVDELSHETEKYAVLLTEWLGLKIDDKRPELTLSADAKTVAVHSQLASKAYAVSCPSGAMNVSFKGMPHEIAVAIGRRLFEKNGLITVFTGIELERDYLEKITSKLAEYGVPAQVWIGRQNQIQELLSLIANSQLYFGADTGAYAFCIRAGYSCIGYLWWRTLCKILPGGEIRIYRYTSVRLFWLRLVLFP